MISALNPLTRWYRIDFLLQRLHQLNCRFYTDTLFSKEKSTVGNTCAQIFKDGEFVQTIPMRSKSETVTKVDRINREFGVENEILMDNSPGQTGYNTEMQIVTRLTRMDVRTTKTHYPWKNKAECVIQIIKGKAKRRRFQRDIPKRVWKFGIVWEYEIYSQTAGNDG